MENRDQNTHSSKEWTLDELLNTGIDDILGDMPDVKLPDTEVNAQFMEETEKLIEDSEQPQNTQRPTRGRKQPSDQNTNAKETVLTYLHDLAYLLAGLVLVFLLLFRVVVVSGTSMNNTLVDGDYLLVLSNTFYQNPSYGDVIVASKQSFDNGAPIVKRVIATEGQKVDIDFEAGIVYVDDVPLEESYTLTPTNEPEGISFPLVVDDGCLFVMGDNRNGSKDSRHPEIGLIDEREVLGKVFFLFFPGTNYGEVARDFGRIGVVS